MFGGPGRLERARHQPVGDPNGSHQSGHGCLFLVDDDEPTGRLGSRRVDLSEGDAHRYRLGRAVIGPGDTGLGRRRHRSAEQLAALEHAQAHEFQVA